ncbi:MAG: preprotein translocase subunit SecE [Clostridia bacterium]|nr:preprotein translocase subunit SecE [Clostridia bacterium]
MAVEKKQKQKKERRFHPIRYLKEMWGEVKKLSWLSKKDLAKHTLAVIAFVLMMATVIWLLDLGFGKGVQGLLSITNNNVSTEETAEPTAEPVEDEATEEPVEDEATAEPVEDEATAEPVEDGE